MDVYSLMMVVQKAERKGGKRWVGSGRRRVERVVQRVCWVVGWGVW